MSLLKIATAAASLALIASPCLAFTFNPAPVDSSGRSMLADPDARLESTTSQMRDAYIQNNGGGSDAAIVRFGGGTAGRASDSSASFGSTFAGAPFSDQKGIWAEGHAPISSAPALGAQGGR